MSSNIKPLQLHAHGSGPNPIKIAIAFELLAVPYEVTLWDFGDDSEKGVKGSRFLAINENGRVPALEDPNTGVVSWESGACLNYVRRVYDNDDKSSSKIGPGSRNEQDIVDFEKWEYFLLTTLGPMTGQVNWFRHYHSSKNDDALERYVAQVYRCYDVLEGQLKKSGGESVLPGGRFTAVDCHFEPWVRQHAFAGLSLDRHPLIDRWLKKAADMDEVKRAYEKIKNGKHA